MKTTLKGSPVHKNRRLFFELFLKTGFFSIFDGISAAQVYGLLFVKVDFLLISLLEAMSEKPENMKNPKFGRVKVHKGKVLPHNAKNVDTLALGHG